MKSFINVDETHFTIKVYFDAAVVIGIFFSTKKEWGGVRGRG
jgi:hypothetical protein